MNNNLSLIRKSNEMMTSLLDRRHVQDVMRAQSGFFLAESGAELVTIFVRQKESEYVSFKFEHNGLVASLKERCHLHLHINELADACFKTLGNPSARNPWRRIDSLRPLFDGIVSERGCRALADASAFREAFLFPVALPDSELIGVIVYGFTQTSAHADPLQLTELSETLQSVLVPLYDEQTGSFYSRYVRVDEEMSTLTSKERDIVKKVLEGENYTSVAGMMGVSINTLKTHMKNIFSKYGVNSKMELKNKIMNG